MKIMSATEAKNQFGALISHVAGGNGGVIIAHHGRPRVVVISAEEWAEVSEIRARALQLEAWEELRTLAAEARERNAGLSEDEADAIVDELVGEAKRRVADRLVRR
jgi:prevent-host-death family protein